MKKIINSYIFHSQTIYYRKLWIILTVLFIQIFQVYSQNLTEIEKENIFQNIKTISNDSALTTAKYLLMSSTFYELTEGEERDSQIKQINIALEILSVLEYKNLNNHDYYSWRAVGYKLLKDYEQAIILISKAIELKPNYEPYYSKRADWKMAIENNYGAIADFTKAISLKPNDDKLLGNRAHCYALTKQYNASLIDSNKAISLNSKVATYYLTRGIVYINLNRPKEACLDFNKAGDLGEKLAFEAIRQFCNN